MGVIVAKLYDLASNELADITPIALEKTMSRRLSGIRTFTIQAPAGHTLLTSAAGDGYPNLRKGNRKLLVWEDGTVIFHGRVWTVERNGNGTENLATITAQMPLAELGYEGNGMAGRPVRGPGGSFIEPMFTGTGSGGAGAVSGPDLILQALTYSQVVGAESPGPGGEGPLPIDLTTGTFDLDVPPAVDLSCVDKMGWPILLGDFIQTLVATGVCDVDERPVDPIEGLDPYVMSAISAVSAFGTDRSGTVHFDYFTGLKNASQCRHLDDFSEINNKLYHYLGPPVASGDPNTRWTSNITPTVAPTDLATAIAASRALYGGPGADPGEFMEIQIFDTIGGESDSRPLYFASWVAEQGYRTEPRALLYITPNPDVKALWQPPADYDVGDLVSVNVGGDFGLAIAATQRVYGYTRTWSREGVATTSELITSADEG